MDGEYENQRSYHMKAESRATKRQNAL